MFESFNIKIKHHVEMCNNGHSLHAINEKCADLKWNWKQSTDEHAVQAETFLQL